MIQSTALQAMPDPTRVVAELVLVAEDVLTMDEAAARLSVPVQWLMQRMADAETLAAVDAAAATSRLSGATGKARALMLRDRLVRQLGLCINDNTPPRVLIDALNAVRHVAALDDGAPKDTGFALHVYLDGGPPSGKPARPVHAVEEAKIMDPAAGSFELPWLASPGHKEGA